MWVCVCIQQDEAADEACFQLCCPKYLGKVTSKHGFIMNPGSLSGPGHQAFLG